MRSTLIPGLLARRLRSASRPLVELDVREDHVPRDDRTEPGHEDTGDKG